MKKDKNKNIINNLKITIKCTNCGTKNSNTLQWFSSKEAKCIHCKARFGGVAKGLDDANKIMDNFWKKLPKKIK